MTNNELLQELKETTGFQLDEKNIYGSISHAANLFDNLMSNDYYLHVFYPEMKHRIDSLPWQTGHPNTSGKYITVAGCNEHEITLNTWEETHWVWLNTHIIGWMPVPEKNDNVISLNQDKNYIWKDNGTKI